MHGEDGPAAGRAERLERLLAAGRALTSELDLPTVLDQILEAASDLTSARYAAIGVLESGRRQGLSNFVTRGLDDQTREAIGDLPRGHGILGLLIDRPEPIRLHDVSQHPRSYGFPLGHPPMRSFLGAPILIRGEAWGNIYLTDKREAEDFTDEDIDTIVVLADWAAVAIDNARLFGEATRRGHELERAVRSMRTTMEIATAVGGDTDLPRILELIVKRGRALVEADALLIWLRYGEDLRVAAVAGNADVPQDVSYPLAHSSAGQALDTRRSIRAPDVSKLLVSPAEYGMPDAKSALIVPLLHRGVGYGVLTAFDRIGSADGFDADDQRALEAFAASAATAVANARSVEQQRLHDTMAAAESERRRWARELHDDTLQGLASLKLALGGAIKAEPDAARQTLASAVSQLEANIAGLREIIADLRPAALDELGLEPALRTLAGRVAEQAGIRVHLDLRLDDARLDPTTETVVYRVAQEALTNVVKHAAAGAVSVGLSRSGQSVCLEVADDGKGLAKADDGGYGIVGMHERAAMAGGRLIVGPGAERGTLVRLELPLGESL